MIISIVAAIVIMVLWIWWLHALYAPIRESQRQRIEAIRIRRERWAAKTGKRSDL